LKRVFFGHSLKNLAKKRLFCAAGIQFSAIPAAQNRPFLMKTFQI
jgi:hypothetical protein